MDKVVDRAPTGEPIYLDEKTGERYVLRSKVSDKTSDKIADVTKKENSNMTEDLSSIKEISELKSEIAKMKAEKEIKEKGKFDEFLKGLAAKVDNVCNEVGGCRKDISKLEEKVRMGTEKYDKDNEKHCVGLDCLKGDLKGVGEKLDKIGIGGKLDKLDRLELFDCPECQKKGVPLYPDPANYCPNCGKPMTWLDDDGKPLKKSSSSNPPWK